MLRYITHYVLDTATIHKYTGIRADLIVDF